MRRSLLLLCTAPMLSPPAALFAVDVPVPAKVSIVKPGRLVTLVSKSDTGFALPTPGTANDPTVGGAEIRFFDTGENGAGGVIFTLDATGWKGLGNPPGSKGYRYKGKDDVGDPEPRGTCKIVLLQESLIKAICKGAAVTLTTPFASSEAVILGLPAGSKATRYCAEVGGEETRNDEKLLKRKNAPAPSACPEPPSRLVGFQPSDVVTLASDEFAGRDNGTAGSVLSQDFLVDELETISLGLNSSQTGDNAFKQPFSGGVNIVALIPGGDLANEYVMIGAHYDHLSSCPSIDFGDTICNGATDNAAGVAAVLAITREIAAQSTAPRRSIVVALWDSEEDGLLGSAHYVANPLVPLASTVAYVNFDIQGSNLLPSLKHFSFAIAAETGGATLTDAIDAALAGEGLDMRKLSFIFGQGRSDYFNLIGANVPSVFFSDATGPCYHTSGDDIDVVDFGKLEKQTTIALKLTRDLADTSTPPTFSSPGSPLATFEDAIVLNDLINAGIADLSLFYTTDQETLLTAQANLNAIVAAGPGNFDSADVAVLLLSTIDTLDALANIDCDGFL